MASETATIRSERDRVILVVLVGIAVAVVSVVLGPWQLAVLLGWIVAGVTWLAWLSRDLAGLDADQTAEVASREDNGRAVVAAATLASSVLSLGAIVAALNLASGAPVRMEVALTAGSLATVVVSWLVVSTVFVLRYARLYYGVGEAGGIDFPGSARPRYRDFAYLGYTVGMTFQVSDTAIEDPTIRSTVLRQALLSYAFSIAIIAMTINVVAGLVG